ncbi:MAG: hexapeptide transferase [Marinilabiliaceae bacterium]|nr:hexapeptide transferase [Marinilabiliaceae bacterium]
MYYIKKLDWNKYRKFLYYISEIQNKSKFRLVIDSVYSSLRYNISIIDYFLFGFYNLSAIERKKWAGTGFMYEYQLRMNPKGLREVLENKIEFLNYFKDFVNRKYHSLNQSDDDVEKLGLLISNSSGLLVVKGSHGQVGAEVEVLNCSDYTPESLVHYMRQKRFNLAEEYIVQHLSLMKLSPSGLNTVRVFTQLNGDRVDILGARLRITVNSKVDNMAAGNLAAPIDVVTGVVCGAGVYSDITKNDCSIHPVTNESIVGFEVPYWQNVIEFVKKAALHVPTNKSIGWDVAITDMGPELIEGNHNWCKVLWQLPVKQGLKAELVKYL